MELFDGYSLVLSTEVSYFHKDDFFKFKKYTILSILFPTFGLAVLLQRPTDDNVQESRQLRGTYIHMHESEICGDQSVFIDPYEHSSPSLLPTPTSYLKTRTYALPTS